jgi:hypothetical protein
VIIFGLATALLEFQIPPQVSRYASFLFSFLGRGVCRSCRIRISKRELTIIVYFFVGSILLHGSYWRYAAGIIIAVVGIAYAVLEFIPSIEPPANMREADGGWGAEQV